MEVFKELELKYRSIEADLTRFLTKNSHFTEHESAFEKIAEQYSSGNNFGDLSCELLVILALIESNNQKRIVSSEIGKIRHQTKKCREYTNCIIPDIPNEQWVFFYQWCGLHNLSSVTAKFQQELENTHNMMISFKQHRSEEFESLRKQEASLNREIDLITRRAKVKLAEDLLFEKNI